MVVPMHTSLLSPPLSQLLSTMSSPIASSPCAEWEPDAIVYCQDPYYTITLRLPNGCSLEDVLIAQYSRQRYDELQITILNGCEYVYFFIFR